LAFRGRVEGVDLGAVLGGECRRLLHAMWMADGVGPVVLGKLHDRAQTERAKSRIVKGSATGNIRDTDP
jgi:hypothetical protein